MDPPFFFDLPRCDGGGSSSNSVFVSSALRASSVEPTGPESPSGEPPVLVFCSCLVGEPGLLTSIFCCSQSGWQLRGWRLG